jgi:hypothetical protein
MKYPRLPIYRTEQEAQGMVARTFAAIAPRHSAEGHAYMHDHRDRYVYVAQRIPDLDKKDIVAEVGPSLMSHLFAREFNCRVVAVHHPLENEWPAHLAPDGVTVRSANILMHPVPLEPGNFRLILLDQVIEHLPVHAGFLLAQLVGALNGQGELIVGAPNFARVSKRIALLAGKNPQEPLDNRFMYYGHHHEPVMGELLNICSQAGGVVRAAEWADPGKHKQGGWMLRILSALIPSLKPFCYVAIRRPASYVHRNILPPFAETGENKGGA